MLKVSAMWELALKNWGVRGWGKVEEVWGTEVPQRGPGQSPGGGLGAKPPEAQKT